MDVSGPCLHRLMSVKIFVVTADINQRLCVIEQLGPGRRGGAEQGAVGSWVLGL